MKLIIHIVNIITLTFDLKHLKMFSTGLKVFAKYITYFLILQSVVYLVHFRERDVMVNYRNSSFTNYEEHIITTSNLEFTDKFTQYDYISEEYIPIFYRRIDSDEYYNVLSHPNFTCYTQDMIKCVGTTNKDINYFYGIFGYSRCNLLTQNVLDCEKNFTTTYLDVNYQVYCNYQYRYNMKTLIWGVSVLSFKLSFTYFILATIYMGYFTLEGIGNFINGTPRKHVSFKID